MKGQGKETILIVEDEALTAIAEKTILEKFGYRVIIAGSGEKAVEIVEKTPEIDLILMDINLGEGMEGTKAAELILEKHDLPLIFLSSHTKREIVEKTEGITSYGYIVKNSGETVLIASIKMAFRLFSAMNKIKEKDEALQESEEKFSTAFRLSPVAIVLSTLEDGQYVDISDRTGELSGYTREEAIGRTATELGIWTDVKDRTRVINKIRENGHIVDEEVIMRDRGGRMHNVSLSAEVITIRGKRYLLSFSMDITERKKAEEALRASEGKFRNIFNNALEGMFRVSLDGKIVQANSRMASMLGYASPEELQEFVSDIAQEVWLDPDDLSHYTALFLKQDFILGYETRFKRKDGGIIRASVNARLVRDNDGNGLYYDGFVLDPDPGN